MGVTFRRLGIRAISAESNGIVADISRLHVTLLPRSPLSRLGEGFLRDFYYRVLPAERILFAVVAYADSVPCGFISATAQVEKSMLQAALRHPFVLAKSLGASIARSPKRIGAMVNVLRIRQETSRGRRVGELLSFGVLEKYCRPPYVTAGGLRIPDALYEDVMNLLRTSQVSEVRAFVDEDNIGARLFYSARGWKIACRNVSSGWPVPTITVTKEMSA